MKKTLLTLSILTSLFAFKAKAQTTVQLYDDALFYGMYQGTVDEPLPPNAIRNNNTSYGIKLTEEQIASFGSTLTLNVNAASNCDNYDRIGNVNVAFVPKGATSYNYATTERIEIARFITPFMVPDGSLYVPYTYDVTNLLDIFKDAALSATYDFWVELEIAGYQGGVGQGGAAEMYPGICAGRDDVYRGSLEFVTEGTYVPADLYFDQLSFKYELKDYTLDGTEEIGETVKSYTFTVDEDLEDASFHVVMSNHGSNSGGEEYKNRTHYIYLDDVEKVNYKPGKNGEPFRQYNTQPNGVYGSAPLSLSYWTSRAWAPGAKIDTRIVPLGALSAGTHTYKMDVPSATFFGDQGYFPMSVYVQGKYATPAGTKGFDKVSFNVSPNPVNDVATITTNGEAVKSFTVVNTLGQVVLTGAGNSINMGQLQNGIYVVKAEFANGQALSQKVVKK
jgi:Peptide-N-glycosidase F, C terminal/Peptide-N-glycosidase F, N terminal/Secretion system C-terminal sorting domain